MLKIDEIIPRVSSKDNKQGTLYTDIVVSTISFLKLIKIIENGDQVKTIFIKKVTLIKLHAEGKSQRADQK